LQPEATVKKYLTVRQKGNHEVKRVPEYYNPDIIISVGYQIKSHITIRFCMWATQRLKEYISRGFIIDDNRLKNGGGGTCFDELPARIRDIRSSERSSLPLLQTYIFPASLYRDYGTVQVHEMWICLPHLDGGSYSGYRAEHSV